MLPPINIIAHKPIEAHMKQIIVAAIILCAASLAVAAGPNPSVRPLTADVHEYVYTRTTGPGAYDHIGVHRVVRVQEKHEGKSEVGVEFLRPDAKFWRLEFPPDDWK